MGDNGDGEPTSRCSVPFQSIVSNAKIGVAPKLSIGAYSALGLNPTSGYTTRPRRPRPSWQVHHLEVHGRDGACRPARERPRGQEDRRCLGRPKYLKSAWADANGIVTFAWKSNSAAAINVRVQLPGNATQRGQRSKALGAYWK